MLVSYVKKRGLDEVTFCDALAATQSAVQAMGDDKLQLIAAEFIAKVRQSVTIDWTLRESARAKIKVVVKQILKKYGYPRPSGRRRQNRTHAGRLLYAG